MSYSFTNRFKTIGIITDNELEEWFSPDILPLTIENTRPIRFLNTLILHRGILEEALKLFPTDEPLGFSFRKGNTTNVCRITDGKTIVFVAQMNPKKYPDTLKDKEISKGVMHQAIQTYYKMAGWDPERAVPTAEKLQELDLGWVVAELDKTAIKK